MLQRLAFLVDFFYRVGRLETLTGFLSPLAVPTVLGAWRALDRHSEEMMKKTKTQRKVR